MAMFGGDAHNMSAGTISSKKTSPERNN